MRSERKLLWSLMVTILFMWMIAALMGCATPKKRLSRFHKRHPELFVQATDSVLTTTTFLFPGVSVNKNFTIDELQREPIIIREKQLSVQITQDETGTNFELAASCDTIRDTIQEWHSYPVYKVDTCECDFFDKYGRLMLLLAVVIILSWGAKKLYSMFHKE